MSPKTAMCSYDEYTFIGLNRPEVFQLYPLQIQTTSKLTASGAKIGAEKQPG
jgi:hypothetical protein